MTPVLSIGILVVASVVGGALLGLLFQKARSAPLIFALGVVAVAITLVDLAAVVQLRLIDPYFGASSIGLVAIWAWVPLALGTFVLVRRSIASRIERPPK